MRADPNPYLPILHRNLPRLLALFNDDTTHPLFGCGDRRYWAWKLLDFPNGTFQGASFGLSLLLANGMLPEGMDELSVLRRIDGMISVVPRLTDRRGSLSEALPNEGSFCVTGLVLGDCLGAINALGSRISTVRQRTLLEGLAPLADFLLMQDETHGLISNHLASTALAMVRWSSIMDDRAALDRAVMWLDRIQTHAHPEGWMREYDGADPGYQSWCTSALAQISTEMPGLDTNGLLQRSFSFLESFALPDGRFAHGCGSRMTRFLMPGGAEIYSGRSDASARLAMFARRHAGSNHFVSLDAIDEPNLVPFFNDFAVAAVHARKLEDVDCPVPKQKDYPAANLYVHCGASGTLLVNSKRGGWATQSDDRTQHDFPEPAARQPDGKVLRPVRGRVVKHSEAEMIIHADLEPVQRMLPTPQRFIVLRLLALTIFRSTPLGNQVKKALAKLLMSETGKSRSTVERKIDLECATITDRITEGDAVLLESPYRFSPMHMASQGYWQVGDDTAIES